MDSIAAPIEDIQFPTVTVCQDEFKEPDNWAAIEAILNNVAFTCKENPRSWDKVMPCEATENVRNDFQFLINSVVEIFKDKLGVNQTLYSPFFAKEVNRRFGTFLANFAGDGKSIMFSINSLINC